MRLGVKRTAIAILDRFKIFFIVFSVVISSTLLNTLDILGQTAAAAEPYPTCTFGSLNGDGSSNIIQIILECENVSIFQGSGDVVALQIDLDKIKLHPDSNPVSPSGALIDVINNQITLNYLTSDQTFDQSVRIYSGALLNDTGSTNEFAINIPSTSIIDNAPPHAQDNFYYFL